MDEDVLITEDRVKKYISITLQARNKATPNNLSKEDLEKLDSMMRMCDDYYLSLIHI